MLVDSSGSMTGGKLEEVMNAATIFAGSQDLSQHLLAVVDFDSAARQITPLTHDLANIENALSQMDARGGTAMGDGLRVAQKTLSKSDRRNHILLFTDGKPNSQETALAMAYRVRAINIQIVAIGTGDADRSFLSSLTGDPNLVLWASAGRFDEAFRRADRLIHGASLVDASTGYGRGAGPLRTGAWTAVLALGIGLGLVAGQNRYLGRCWLSRGAAIVGGSGAALVGFLAGGGGQVLFVLMRSDLIAYSVGAIMLGAVLGIFLGFAGAGFSFKPVACATIIGMTLGLLAAVAKRWLLWHLPCCLWLPSLLAAPAWCVLGGGLGLALSLIFSLRNTDEMLRAGVIFGGVGRLALFVAEAVGGPSSLLITDATTRVVAWGILGGLLAGGMVWFVPNLNRRYATVAGAGGGLVSAALFLGCASAMGGFSARLGGAVVLGFLLGLAVVLAEQACRQAWLELVDANGRQRHVNLGRDPVTIGGNSTNDLLLERSADEALTYRLDGGRLVCVENDSGRTRDVRAGQSRIVGGARITVRQSC